MKFLFPTLLFCILVSASLADDGKRVTKDEFSNATACFHAEPLTEKGRVAAGLIVEFAEQSHEIEITIGSSLVPWIGIKDNTNADYRSLLLGAYVAGNAKSQIMKGVKADDPYSGMLFVFAVYEKMKIETKGFKIAEIENFIKLEKRKQLKEHLENNLKHEKRAEEKRKKKP